MQSFLLAAIAFAFFYMASQGRVRTRMHEAPSFEMSEDGRVLLEDKEGPPPYGGQDNAVRVIGSGLGLLFWLAIPFEPFYASMPLEGAGYKALQFLGLVSAALGAGVTVAGVLANAGAPRMNLGVKRAMPAGGVYALVRYPVYLGAILLYLGLAMMNRRLIPICMAPLFPLSLLRHMVTEDASNHAMFGPDYADYRAKTPALFPFPVNLVAGGLYLAGLFIALTDRSPGTLLW
ncbi:MAG: hypothetical protein K8I02_08090 [Candidatus Methylomirabilis sp.]|nr:hypothetical protein [Deltaproteobacteria bacterium]